MLSKMKMRKERRYDLVNSEKNLCERELLKPHEYLLMKEMMMRESTSQGCLSKEFVNMCLDPKRNDKGRILETYDFLVNHELVTDDK